MFSHAFGCLFSWAFRAFMPGSIPKKVLFSQMPTMLLVVIEGLGERGQRHQRQPVTPVATPWSCRVSKGSEDFCGTFPRPVAFIVSLDVESVPDSRPEAGVQERKTA